MKNASNAGIGQRGSGTVMQNEKHLMYASSARLHLTLGSEMKIGDARTILSHHRDHTKESKVRMPSLPSLTSEVPNPNNNSPAPECHHVLCISVSGDINTFVLRLICCIQILKGSNQLRCPSSISASSVWQITPYLIVTKEDPFLVDRASADHISSSPSRKRRTSEKSLMTKESGLHLYATGIIETILTSQSSVPTVCNLHGHCSACCVTRDVP